MDQIAMTFQLIYVNCIDLYIWSKKICRFKKKKNQHGIDSDNPGNRVDKLSMSSD